MKKRLPPIPPLSLQALRDVELIEEYVQGALQDCDNSVRVLVNPEKAIGFYAHALWKHPMYKTNCSSSLPIGDGARSALQLVTLRFSSRHIILPAFHGEIGTHCRLIRKVRE
jgi:hypothetical protein